MTTTPLTDPEIFEQVAIDTVTALKDHVERALTHGGSLGNLTCSLAARARIAPE